MSPIAKELLFDFVDLKLVGVQCHRCQTEIIWDASNGKTAIPSKCSACGNDFDPLFVTALETFRDAYRNLSKSDNSVRIRIRKPITTDQ